MTGSADVALRVRGLGASYGDHRVFEDVTFDVATGSVTAVIGPSGGGKSTLLRAITRLEEPDAGTVTVAGTSYEAGRTLDAASTRHLHQTVGLVFQQFNLFPHMTALRNITFAQERVLGRSREEAERVAADLLARVGLDALGDRHPRRLSGGQQQRVAIARALALGPQVMLFDEPTSSLDPEIADEVLQVIRALAADGMTMVVVTHEMRFAAEVADQLLVIADGHLVETGRPRDVLAAPTHPRTVRFLRSVLGR